MADITCADYIAETLAGLGVERIWGVTGDSLNGINDSLRRLGRIRWMHVRHEETGAFAAGSEAAATGQLAVCAGSCGPGNLHLINGPMENCDTLLMLCSDFPNRNYYPVLLDVTTAKQELARTNLRRKGLF